MYTTIARKRQYAWPAGSYTILNIISPLFTCLHMHNRITRTAAITTTARVTIVLALSCEVNGHGVALTQTIQIMYDTMTPKFEAE
jgi:hypothetical protein